MQYVSDLTYKPTANNTDYVAKQVCNSATDQNWTINIQGSVDGDASNINPNFITADNYTNKQSVTLSFGPYSWTVGALSRKTFRLPVPTQQVILNMPNNGNGNAGSTTLYLVQNPNFSPDDANLLAIQETARGVNLYPFVSYNAALVQQQVSDANCVVEFTNNAANTTYVLVQSGVVTSNGWFQFVFNNGTKIAYMLPFGAETLNGIFNNANPFAVYPGEWGVLSNDGTQWFCKIFGQKTPTVTYTGFVTTQSPNDINKRLAFSAGAGQVYDLLPAVTFANGDKLKIRCISGVAVAITPNGTDTINGVFTNAAPLFLEPGDEIDLYINDAGVWWADGVITFKSSLQQFNAAISGSITHNMGGTPDDCKCWVQAVGAEINYNVGDIFQLGLGSASSTNPGGEHVVSPGPTAIWWCIAANAGIRLPNKTTGVSSNIASGATYLTNFQLFFIAKRRL